MQDWRLDEQELKPETPLFAKPKFQSSVSDFIESACAAIFCDSHNHHMLTSRAHSCTYGEYLVFEAALAEEAGVQDIMN